MCHTTLAVKSVDNWYTFMVKGLVVFVWWVTRRSTELKDQTVEVTELIYDIVVYCPQ